MSVQTPTLPRSRGDVRTPFASGEAGFNESAASALMYRQAEGLSIAALNKATHGIGGRKVTRILDFFTLPFIYPVGLEQVRGHSPLEDPPSVEELTEELTDLRLGSFDHSVEATVLGVRPHSGTVAVYVDYRALYEEQRVMAQTVSGRLGLSQPHRITPNTAYITIIEGQLRDSQIIQIYDTLPPKIDLSPVQFGPSS